MIFVPTYWTDVSGQTMRQTVGSGDGASGIAGMDMARSDFKVELTWPIGLFTQSWWGRYQKAWFWITNVSAEPAVTRPTWSQ